MNEKLKKCGNGFRKQLNKTSQLLSEKVGKNKGSQFDDDIVKMGRKLDVVSECIENVQNNTKAYLQPNPTARKKLTVQASYQKAIGKSTEMKYPQPEFSLAEVFTDGGKGLNDESSPYASTLLELGSTFNQLSDAKDKMEGCVKRDFLQPLHELQQKDLKEINHHRKKMKSRRLEYDYTKTKGKMTDEEMYAAEEKFNKSKQLYYNSMLNFMDNDVEHISQFHAFSVAIRDYHKECGEIIESLVQTLSSKLVEAENREKVERPNIVSTYDDDSSADDKSMSSRKSSDVDPPTVSKLSPVLPNIEIKQPCARALYDYEPQNDEDLKFKVGDMIELKSKVDENWLEGSCNGQYGYLPANFVEIVVPFPS